MKVKGNGRATGPPDHARITIHLRARSESGATAFDEVAARSKKLESLLEELGISKEAVSSRDVQLREEARSDRSQPQVLVAEHELEVTVSHPFILSQLVTAATQEVDTTVSGLSWQLEPGSPLHHEALRKAAEDARGKAETYASALHLRLGEVIEISDWDRYSGQQYHERLGGFEIPDQSRVPAFEIYEGPVHVDASIEVTFALEPG